MSSTVAALFVERDTVYRAFEGVDCWDESRDARRWPGGCPGVFHPPCRTWGQLRQFAKAPEGEHELALWAVEQCRRWGGVVEHPLSSQLWDEVGVGSWGVRDSFGGVLVPMLQCWYGHRAPKATGLYVVGPVPVLEEHGQASSWVELMGRRERLRTPRAMAELLVGIARGCH